MYGLPHLTKLVQPELTWTRICMCVISQLISVKFRLLKIFLRDYDILLCCLFIDTQADFLPTLFLFANWRGGSVKVSLVTRK